MKHQNKLFFLVTAGSVALATTSCTKSLGEKQAVCNGAPQITSVREAAKDGAITVGEKLKAYSVVGTNLKATKQLWINGFEIFVNPALATETHLLFTIPDQAPWRGASKLKIKSDCGEVETNFGLKQPPPVINDFFPVAGNTGDTITINGDIFDKATSVKFDNETATIISVTPTQIKVKLPANVAIAFINITTPGGTVKSKNPFGGIKYAIFDDGKNSNWWEGSWGGVYELNNTTTVKRGTTSIKATYNGGYSGLQFGTNDNAGFSLDGFEAVKLSIYGGTGITANPIVRVYINDRGNSGVYKEVTVKEGQWTDFTIPFSELGGKPSTITRIVVQEGNGSGKVIYIDDLGLI
jgi:hypothetical protein